MPTSTTHSALAEPITRQLIRFIYVSIGLSLVILACSLVFFGYTSFWLSPSGFLLTMIHHGSLLFNHSKLRKRLASAGHHHPDSPPLPVSSSKVFIGVTWFIVVVWLGALGVVITMLVVSVMDSEEAWDTRYIALGFELAFLVFEICIMTLIGIWCIRQRRLLVGASEGRPWYRLGKAPENNI